MKNKPDKFNILLTGGHAATTALSTIEEIKRQGKNWDLYWVGARYALEGKNVPTLEKNIFSKTGVNMYYVYTGKIQRKLSVQSLVSLLKIPIGFIHGFLILKKINPSVVLSFGGFAAFPIIVNAWIRRKPILIHEQTSAAGLANRKSSYFASKIALARETSKKYFPKEKSAVIGNPISNKIKNVKIKKTPNKPKVIYITGGSRGSQIINNAVFEILDKLLKKYKVIHQVGHLDFDKAENIYKNLDSQKQKKYKVFSIAEPNDIKEYFQEADIIISRAGANTVSEIIYTKRPAVLIPIPWSYLDEQTKNAIYAKDYGIASILPQKDLNGERLLDEIIKVDNNWQNIINKVSNKESTDEKASERLVNLVSSLLDEKKY